VGQIERLSRNRDDLHARVSLTVSEPIGNCRREVAASFPSPLVETMALSTCQIKDYLYQWCLQFLVRTYGVNVSIKRNAANALCELLPLFIKEMGGLSERLAREEGRVAVNASDVLCSYGDIDGLMAFWSATSAQTCGMNVCNLSRNRCAKLRPTISEVQESHPEYVPSFLPLLPKHSSLITDGRFQRTEYRDNASPSKRHKAGHFCEPGGPSFSQNTLRLANSRESTVLSRSICESLAQPLRNPVKEEKLVTRASQLLGGTTPVLDNS